MTAVGAIAGLGVATGTIQWDVMGRIVSWWLVAPILAFWICAIVGRYLYPYLDAWFRLDEATGVTAVAIRTLVVAIGCYMAFSAGASNVANAVAPLVAGGTGPLTVDQGVLLAGGAIGLGAFTIARRTLDTVGNDLTDLPLLAALVVEVVAASLITLLSTLGIPASLAVSATMCIVGLGWGRATRVVRLTDATAAAVRGDAESLATKARDGGEDPTGEVPRIGEADPDAPRTADLFDPTTTGRVVFLWVLTPSLAAVASFLLFNFAPI
jgi:PiT family inorganic phosphate transporter